MRVFLTGATGFIGSRIIPELVGAGHEVTGLTRSDEGARKLEAAGVTPYRGTLEQPEDVARGAGAADAVIHAAFDHDFDHFYENCQKDARVISAVGAALAGSTRPFLITSGVNMGRGAPGEPATEENVDLDNPNPRVATERAGVDALAKGASVAVVRLPQVHDTQKQGLITPYIAHARAVGACAYVGDGSNRWSAAHVGDVARLYRLALEHHAPGARWHAVAEPGVAMRDIVEVIGAGLGLPVRSLPPEQAAEHFGWMAGFAGLDMLASSTLTQERLDWRPDGPTLLDDLRAMNYGYVMSS